LFITDGGLETDAASADKIEVPAFAACPLLDDAPGRQRLADYYRGYLDLAANTVSDSSRKRHMAGKPDGRKARITPRKLAKVNGEGIRTVQLGPSMRAECRNSALADAGGRAAMARTEIT